MQDTRDCPYTTHSFKTLGKCYKKCPYFSSLSMKYMHNVQESYKKIILLAITSHLTESLKARSTIHQAQEYPGGYAYIASLKKEQKGVLGAAEGRARCHTRLLATRGPPRRPADPPAAILPQQGCCHPKLPPSSQDTLPAPHHPQGLQETLRRRGLREPRAPKLVIWRVWRREFVRPNVCPDSLWKAGAIKYLTY